nr:sporulation protein YtxC [Sedimentibacter sp.]
MELLSLEINENENDEIAKNIEIITNVDGNDLNIEISSAEEGIIRIEYFTKETLNRKDCLEKVISKITKLLLEYTKRESCAYLEENYFYFDEDEFEQIKQTIEEEVENDIKIQLVIKNKLKEIIENSKTINLNGFIKFRLKFISLYASQIVEKCIDNYLMKKEYLDFISVIRYISDVEEKEHETVNIMYNNHKLQIYDSNMKKLNYIGTIEISQELDGKILEYNELIINVLLNISPRKIILHTNVENGDEESENTIEIIKRIFENKVEICKGCKFCELV